LLLAWNAMKRRSRGGPYWGFGLILFFSVVGGAHLRAPGVPGRSGSGVVPPSHRAQAVVEPGKVGCADGDRANTHLVTSNAPVNKYDTPSHLPSQSGKVRSPSAPAPAPAIVRVPDDVDWDNVNLPEFSKDPPLPWQPPPAKPMEPPWPPAQNTLAVPPPPLTFQSSTTVNVCSPNPCDPALMPMESPPAIPNELLPKGSAETKDADKKRSSILNALKRLIRPKPLEALPDHPSDMTVPGVLTIVPVATHNCSEACLSAGCPADCT